MVNFDKIEVGCLFVNHNGRVLRKYNVFYRDGEGCNCKDSTTGESCWVDPDGEYELWNDPAAVSKKQVHQLSRSDFRRGGELAVKYEWTADELKLLVDTLERTIAFLEGRGDSGIVVFKLRLELQSYLDMGHSLQRYKQ